MVLVVVELGVVVVVWVVVWLWLALSCETSEESLDTREESCNTCWVEARPVTWLERCWTARFSDVTRAPRPAVLPALAWEAAWSSPERVATRPSRALSWAWVAAPDECPADEVLLWCRTSAQTAIPRATTAIAPTMTIAVRSASTVQNPGGTASADT